MGLKLESEYTIPELKIIVPCAYAKLDTVTADKDGNVKVTFNIQQTRESCDDVNIIPLEVKEFNFIADKTLPLWEQAYIIAKQDYFSDWIDDIPFDEINEEKTIIDETDFC